MTALRRPSPGGLHGRDRVAARGWLVQAVEQKGIVRQHLSGFAALQETALKWQQNRHEFVKEGRVGFAFPTVI